MDVLTSETCWALNNEIIKQVTSSWSLFTQLFTWRPSHIYDTALPTAAVREKENKVVRYSKCTVKSHTKYLPWEKRESRYRCRSVAEIGLDRIVGCVKRGKAHFKYFKFQSFYWNNTGQKTLEAVTERMWQNCWPLWIISFLVDFTLYYVLK